MPEVDDKLRAWLSERNVDQVEALVPDITGNARGKIIPAYRFLTGEGVRLPEALLVQTVTGEWPDDDVYDELVHPADRDLFLIPDTSTARMVPWAVEPTAQIFHDCVDAEGNYHELASRNVLRSVLQRYSDDGLEPIIAPEVEFYLVEKNINSDNRLRLPIGRSGRPERARQSYSIDALNVFASPGADDLTDTFRHYIGGLQKYTPAAIILYAPYVNSYRRIAYGDSAPKNVASGIDNRTAGLRVPVSSADNRRIESRFADSDVNPYLAIAATLACGYLGIKEKIEPTPPTEERALGLAQTLPVAFEVSLALLEEETALQEILGQRFIKAYVGIKRKEFETFFRVINSWEHEYLLLNVCVATFSQRTLDINICLRYKNKKPGCT